jgi:hypothetical protein
MQFGEELIAFLKGEKPAGTPAASHQKKGRRKNPVRMWTLASCWLKLGYRRVSAFMERAQEPRCQGWNQRR